MDSVNVGDTVEALLVGIMCLTGLIVFTRWIVHTEVTRLTSAMHADVMKIDAKLALLVGRKWTDEKLDRTVDDLRSVLNAHDAEIEQLRRDHIRFHAPPGKD